MSSLNPNDALTRIRREAGSPLVSAFLEWLQERIEQAHQKMETAETEKELRHLQGRIQELKDLSRQLTETRQAKFKTKDGHYF